MWRAAGGRLLLLGIGVAFVLLAAEGVLRLRNGPNVFFRGAQELTDFRKGGRRIRAAYETDAELGFRPVLDGRHYSRFGTLVNSYPSEKRDGIARLLFLGDSVTHRARIVRALRSLFGEDHYEYWNAGVEGFNTVQEVHFYKRYNRALRPDHVILTFHLNDFETTPVAFVDRAGRLVVVAPQRPLRPVNRWLYEHSLLHRMWLGITSGKDEGRIRFSSEVRASLEDLRDAARADGAALTVLVLPILARTEDWRDEDRARRTAVLSLLADLGIRHFDLLAAMQRALADGVEVGAGPGDGWHPSQRAAEYFAAFLHEKSLLQPRP